MVGALACLCEWEVSFTSFSTLSSLLFALRLLPRASSVSICHQLRLLFPQLRFLPPLARYVDRELWN